MAQLNSVGTDLNPINHGLYENLLTMGGGQMAPQPENAINLKVGGKTW